MENLTRREKETVERLMKTKTVAEIAQELGIEETRIRNFIKKRFGPDQTPHTSSSSNRIFTPVHIQHRIDQISWKWVKKHWLIFTGLAILCLVVYVNSLQNVFVSDDLALGFHPLGTWGYIFSQPQLLFRKLIYFITFHLVGRAPWAYRFGNIVFHISSVWLTFTFLWVLTKKSIAIPAALLLAVHPITVEAVAWISAGVHPQYTSVLLLAFLFYIKSYKNMKYFWLSFVLFCMAVLTSEKAIIFPFLILLYEFSLETVRVNKNKLFMLFGITVVLGLSVGFYALQRLSGLAHSHYLQNGFDNPFITVPVALSSYFWTLIWPQELTLYQTEIIPNMVVFWLKVVGLLLYIAAIIISWRRNRFVFFCLAFFVIALLPMLLPIRIAWIMAERYAYLGLVGIFGAVGYYFFKLYEKKKYRQVATVIGIIILVLLSIRSMLRNADWKNEDVLWVATVKSSPNSPNAHNNMGDVYSRYNHFDLAEQEFKTAVALKKDYGDAYHNVGNSLQNQGKLDEAKDWYQKALAINPRIWQTYAQLASIAAEEKNYDEAEILLKKALELSPNNPDIFMNLAILYNLKGDKETASLMLKQGLTLNPNHPKGPELLKLLSQ